MRQCLHSHLMLASILAEGYRLIGSGNPNNVGRNGPPERMDGLSHGQVTVEQNPTTGTWETVTMFPALP